MEPVTWLNALSTLIRVAGVLLLLVVLAIRAHGRARVIGVLGSVGYWPDAIELITSGRVLTEPLVTGTYPLDGGEAVKAVANALQTGYRLVDTAVNYGNEEAVGEGLRRSGIPRGELNVTSKLPGRHHGYDDAIASVRASLGRIGLDYIDLHLIH